MLDTADTSRYASLTPLIPVIHRSLVGRLHPRYGEEWQRVRSPSTDLNSWLDSVPVVPLGSHALHHMRGKPVALYTFGERGCDDLRIWVTTDRMVDETLMIHGAGGGALSFVD